MEYKIKITAETAEHLAVAIRAMTEGGAPSKEQREQVREKISTLFKDGDLLTKTADLDLTSREVRAIAHGAIDIMSRDNRIETVRGQQNLVMGASGEVYSFYRNLTKKLNMWKYVENIIKPESAVDFDGELDDAPPLIDAPAEGDVPKE